uniref:Uncharacterized protein n=1 Tax=Candidatus Kentrum sp. DK TaxID=2126562 RepID=A0A450ST28_9GAMM|nr:MAG: hypothetical protein BECKDK2373C_GA0170839_105712 [Candidatus Kentron sp. DK]
MTGSVNFHEQGWKKPATSSRQGCRDPAPGTAIGLVAALAALCPSTHFPDEPKKQVIANAADKDEKLRVLREFGFVVWPMGIVEGVWARKKGNGRTFRRGKEAREHSDVLPRQDLLESNDNLRFPKCAGFPDKGEISMFPVIPKRSKIFLVPAMPGMAGCFRHVLND